MSESWSPTIQRMLHREMSRFSTMRCLAWEGGEASYAETLARCVGLAAWLQRSTETHSRIAIALPNGREFIELIAACALAGRVRVPLNPKESAETLATKLHLTSCAVLFTTTGVLDKLGSAVVESVEHVVVTDGKQRSQYEAIASADADDLALDAEPGDVYRISFTGGTTGAPRGIVQTHRQEAAMIRNLLMETIRPSGATTFVAATPLSHASGAFVVPTLLRGGVLSWLDSFDAARLVDASWLGFETAVETFLVPTAMADVTQAAKQLTRHDLSTVVYGGAPCPPAVLKEAVATLGECLVQVYGQAEAPMTIAVLPREAHRDIDHVSGSVGWPFMFVDVAIVNGAGERMPTGQVGEVLVAAEHVMSRYWGAEAAAGQAGPEEPASGWLRTGDLGFSDESGLLRLVGRARNMIISGGMNLFPDEVDRRLSGLPGVADIASFGVPHPRWGEALVIAVTRGDPSLTSEEVEALVKAAARERLSSYEQPKRVLVLERLPVTDVGKTDKRSLAEHHSALFEEMEVGQG